MNDKVMRMAREAGIFVANNVSMVVIVKDQLKAFEALVRADEREACAKECKKLLKVFLSPQYSTGQPLSSFKERHAVATCIESIRARGNT